MSEKWKVCGKVAQTFIAREGSFFPCALEEGHEGRCIQSGNCFRHGIYYGGCCPHWPTCVNGPNPDPKPKPASLESRLERLEQEFHRLERIIRRILEEPVEFTLEIYQVNRDFWDYFPQGEFSIMPAITAGSSGTFLLSATASDNSTPVLSAQTLTADDASVTIAQDTDPNTFTVTVPASDTATTFNLDATASVTSNTSTTPQEVKATLAVTISPASIPVSFTLSISEK